MNQVSEKLSNQSKQVIDSFLDALWMERGLSSNTLFAYRSDLYKFSIWFQSRKVELLKAKFNDIQDYLSDNYSVRTIARRLSSLRRLYEYLLRENRIKQNSVSKVEAHRLGCLLPKSLTESEVEALLNAPDTEQLLGLRDKTMLELLLCKWFARIRTGQFNNGSTG